MRLLPLVVLVLISTPDRAVAACSSGCIDIECYGSASNAPGDCVKGCRIGYHGRRCDMTCFNCVKKTCGRFRGGFCNEGCVSGYYGDRCDMKCPANCSSCNIESYCSGCKNGNYGRTCQLSCPANCRSNQCDMSNGECTTGCDDGFTGLKCDAIKCDTGYYSDGSQCNACPENCASCSSNTNCDYCLQGYYGYNCESPCSLGCNDNSCDKLDGRCKCKEGYAGENCDQCDYNWYPNQNICYKCPTNCLSCASVNNCSKCSSGYHGVICGSECSPGCLNKHCHGSNGNCFRCNRGYQGDTCNQCLYGWYKDQNSCYKCPTHCLSCTSGHACSLCIQGYYGVTCGYACPQTCVSCSSDNSCSECKTGYYGFDCGSTCSPGCLYNNCDKSDGRCNSASCTEGYDGDTCEQCLDGWYNYNTICMKCPTNCLSCTSGDLCSLCKEGYFGVKCGSECSPGCSNTNCNKTDGKCNMSLCNDGYQGSKCNQCLSGWYKLNNHCNQCQKNCLSCTSQLLCTSCEEGYYGAYCQYPCSPECVSCTSGYNCESCKVGHYGQDCQNLCSSGCINSQCGKADGQCECKVEFTGLNCSQCANGKFGTYCDQDCSQRCISCSDANSCVVCKTGYYGPACELSCSVGCAGECFKNSGNCYPCKDRFSGNKCCVKSNNCKLCSSSTGCSECKSGYHGIKCEETCPKNCNVSCDKQTGNCVTCNIGYFGPYCGDTCSENCMGCKQDGTCTSCKAGFYGLHCNNACPGNCETCSDSNLCFSCKSGYFNQTCDLKCPKKCVSCYSSTKCKQCKDGYTGYSCSNRCDPNCKTCLMEIGYFCSSCALGKHTNSRLLSHSGEKYSYCSYACPNFCLHGVCNETTGHCSKGCVDGYTGEKCLCPENCANGGCNKRLHTCNRRYCESGYTGDTCSCSKKACTDYACSECINNTWYAWSEWSSRQKQIESYCCKCSGMCKDNKCSDALTCLDGCVEGFYGYGCIKRCFEKDTRCRTCTDTTCTQCVSGYFPSSTGKCTECSQQCGNGNCSSHNGTCFEGCEEGFWDKDCTRHCAPNCKECDRDSGTCTVCKNGKYRRDCSEKCNDRCLNTGGSAMCGIDDGSCKLGCTSKTFYGNTCELNCSITCFGQGCDWITGKCSNGCISNFFGEWCENKCSDNCFAGSDSTRCQSSNGTCIFYCHEGYFGHDCEARCGANCVNATCSRGTGHCIHGCLSGFEGSDCAKVLKQPGSVNTGVITGAVVSGILTLLVAVVLVIFYILRQRRRKASTKSESTPARPDHSNIAMDEVGAVASNASVAVSLGEENVVDLPLGDVHADVSDTYNNATAITRVTIDRLEEYVARKPRESLNQEFLMFPKTLIKPYNDSQRPTNASRNRYKDVYPYDFNRVKLQTGNTDYINASYIDGFKKKNEYIAALGPTDKATGNFVTVWTMIWQQKVEKIVMLTNLVEGGNMKCDQYWPNPDTSQQYGDVTVTCMAEDTTSQFTVRALSVTMNDEKRMLHHFHYTAWPDRGVPDDVTGLIEFRDNVLVVKSNLDGPVMVHCSAGVGRTGTYIALDYLTNEGEESGTVDVFECVSNLRQQRIWMVQTEEQYVYLHDAVVHSLTFDSKPIASERFKNYLQSLTPANLQKSYEHLNFGYDRREPEDKDSVQRNSSYKNKNNPTADIPGDRYRPRLYLGRVDESCDYVNAVYLDSFRSRNQFIVAQTPMKSTLDDFLTLLFQDHIPCIVDMQPHPRNKKYVGDYVPADNSKQVTHGIFTVKSTKVKSSTQFVLRRLTIIRDSQQGPEERVFYHYQHVGWNDNSLTPQSPPDFIQFVREVEIKAREDSENGKILVHCVSGAERSGLFCAVSVMLQKMESEHEISVVNTVRQIKSRRSRAIPNKEQYLFCHQCIGAYLDTFDTYSNFAIRQ